eukprot:1942960-Pleurochrysis_carterae.AAC.2
MSSSLTHACRSRGPRPLSFAAHETFPRILQLPCRVDLEHFARTLACALTHSSPSIALNRRRPLSSAARRT